MSCAERSPSRRGKGSRPAEAETLRALRTTLRGRVPAACRGGYRDGELPYFPCRLRLARAPGRPIGAERARAQPQARPQRRRDVVERSATIAAQVGFDPIRAQPMPACRTLRIDTLHGPTRQILHGTPSPFPRLGGEKLGGFWCSALVVSREKGPICSGLVPAMEKAWIALKRLGLAQHTCRRPFAPERMLPAV